MLARKGLALASSQPRLLARVQHTDQSAALSFRITRLFSSSRAVSRASEPARVPRPIPLDIGNGPSASAFFQPSANTATTAGAATTGEAATALGGGPTRRKYRGSSNNTVFDRFGGPIINVIVYSTAASLALHLLYNHLALEEYRISSNKKVAALEAEITAIKERRGSNSVQHSLGGRGEFV